MKRNFTPANATPSRFAYRPFPVTRRMYSTSAGSNGVPSVRKMSWNHTFGSAAASGSAMTSSRRWGTHNGEAFDQSSGAPESWGGAVSLPGSPVPVEIADGMESAFVFDEVPGAGGMFFSYDPPQLPLPTSPIAGRLGKAQDLYNKYIQEIGEKAKGKVVTLEVQKRVMQDIATRNKASGTVAFDEGGYTIVANMGFGKQLDEEYRKWERGLIKIHGKRTKVEMRPTKLEVSYAVDMAPSANPAKKRSGNVAVKFRVLWQLEVTKPNGQVINVERPSDVRVGAQLHSGDLENRNLQP